MLARGFTFIDKHMQTEATIMSRKRKIFLRFTFSSLLFLFALWGYYVVLSVRAVNSWIQATNEKYGLAAANREATANWENESYLRLQQKNGFLRAKMKMAATDSIGLSLNLADSIISLEISGVTVSSAKIKKIRASRSLEGLDFAASVKLFSEPMRIAGSGATIVKEPIIEKIAPKTADEAGIHSPIPDTARKEPVFFELWFESGLKLLVLQQENESRLYRKNRLNFLWKRAIKRTAKNLNSVIRFKKPEYHPEILIMIPAADARAIYRAIPENGRVVICYNIDF